MKHIAIIGAGDLGRQIAYFASISKQFKIAGFFDDFKKDESLIEEVPVLGGSEDILPLFKKSKFDALLVGIGYKHMNFRKSIYKQFKGKIPFAKLIHESCIVDPSATIEEGTVIYPGCIIDQKVTIRPNVLMNVGCSISHHTEIGAHSFLSPRTAIAGFVEIGEACNIGINATIIDNLKITDKVRLGGGAVVIEDIKKEGLYVGNPVRFIR